MPLYTPDPTYAYLRRRPRVFTRGVDPCTPTVREVLSGHADGAAVTLVTDAGTQVDDVLVCIHGNDFDTVADLTTPTGTAGTWTLQATGDNGSSSYHVKIWTRPVTSGGAQTVTVPDTGAAENFQILFVLAGADTVDPSDDAAGSNGTASTSHVAPSVSPTTSRALLICAAVAAVTDYTAPGGMSEADEEDGDFATLTAATEVLTASGATGTRTFTSSASSAFATASIAVRSACDASGSSGAGVTQQRSTTAGTGSKQSAAAGATVNRSATADTGRKQGSGTGSPLAHTSTQDTGRKQAAGAGVSPARALTTSSGARGTPAGPGAVPQRSTTVSSTAKGGTGTASSVARPATSSTGAKSSAGVGATVQRSSTTDTGRKQGSGVAAAIAHPVTQVTTEGVVGGAAASSARTSTTSTGTRSGAGAGLSFTHPVTAAWGSSAYTGGGLVTVGAVTQAQTPTAVCETPRPNTGLTARPGSGTTARPDTGSTAEPC